jgi:hypothetical protein
MVALEPSATTLSDNSVGLSHEEERIFSATLFTINIILPPIVIILGLVGNFLAFVVLRQPQYAKQTTCFYMRVLAIFDSSALLSHVTLRTVTNYNPEFMFGREAGPVVCPLLGVFFRVYLLSNWTIAAMTFDRFLAIRFPLQVASWSTMTRCKNSVFGIIFVFIAIAIPDTLNGYNPHGLVTLEICRYNPKIFPASFIGIYRVVASTIVYTIPFLSILVFNISIIATLVQQRIQKDNISSHQAQTSKKEGHITVLLFLVTMVFFMTSIPWTVDKWTWFYIMPVINTVRMAWIRKLAYELTIFVLFINP